MTEYDATTGRLVEDYEEHIEIVFDDTQLRDTGQDRITGLNHPRPTTTKRQRRDLIRKVKQRFEQAEEMGFDQTHRHTLPDGTDVSVICTYDADRDVTKIDWMVFTASGPRSWVPREHRATPPPFGYMARPYYLPGKALSEPDWSEIDADHS